MAIVSHRVAVVGTSFGARIHVPALREAGFEVVALVGTDAQRTGRRAERLGVEHACTSLREALELGLHAVSIATPPATHAPLAKQAIASGCHVLCEKPFTLDTREAAALSEAADAAGRVGLLGHEFRWSPLQSIVEWALGEELIGAPRLALSISFLSMLRAIDMPEWWFDPQRGGGWLGASGSHRIDALRQWFGEVEAVSATLPALREPALPVDDSFDIRCRMRSGVEACLIQSASAVGPMYSSTRVLGTEGTLWADGAGVRLATTGDPDPGGHLLAVPAGAELPDVEHLATGALADMTRTELPSYIRLAQAFRTAIEGGAPDQGPRPATFTDGLACMRVLDAARRSAADGGSWQPVPQR